MSTAGPRPQWALGIIPCGSSKAPVRTRAVSLYTGTLFKAACAHAAQRCSQVLILSARYGLVGLEEELEPYEAYLPQLTSEQRRELGSLVIQQSAILGIPHCSPILSYLPEAYHRFLLETIPNQLGACRIRRPYAGLTLGWLISTLKNEHRNYGTHPARR